jgi:plastocyanin
VLGSNFEYDIREMRVQQGDKVTVTFRSIDGFHDWVVDEFNAATQKVQTNGETTVSFIANKKGSFEYYCSVGSHRAKGMVGTLIVE